MDAFEKLVQWANGMSLWGALAWLGGAIVVILGIKGAAKNGIASMEAWMALPTLDQYWERHPDCKTNSGPKCYRCGSKTLRSIRGNGFAGDQDRTIVCRHCGTVLYRISGEVTEPILRAMFAKHAPGKTAEEAWRSVVRRHVAKNDDR